MKFKQKINLITKCHLCLSGCSPDAMPGSEHCEPPLCYFLKNSVVVSTITLGEKNFFIDFIVNLCS